MQEAINVIHHTMHKSLLDDLSLYLKLNGNQNKFCIYSDYCLDDVKKPNKVASFTIAPMGTALPEATEEITIALPKDIKKSKMISGKGVDLLVNKSFFHINFIIKDTSGILYSENKTSQKVILEALDETINMISSWIDNQPEGAGKFKEQIKKFKQWQCELKKKSININLTRNILLISMLAAYIAFLLTKYAKAEDIIWFSDRDKIVDSYNRIAYEIFDICHFGFCDQLGATEPYSNIGIPSPDITSGALWFDHLIRIPDYLAGTLASWDISNNEVERIKHDEILKKVFAENDFCGVIDLAIGQDDCKCSHHKVFTTKVS